MSLTKIIIKLIRNYKKFVSPLLHSVITPIYGNCRYFPTCSEYAILALTKHGIIKGTFKAIFRILRCNPFSKGGIDYP